MKKRILALMLCLALVLGLAAPVYAEESEPAGDGVEITVEPETPAPSESVEPETPAPSESVEPEPPVPSESVEPETPAPSESVEPETPAPSESVELETPAPGESVEPTAPVTELCEHGNDPATCEQCQAAAQQQADGGLYAALLAAESLEEVEQLVSDLTEEEAQAFLESLTEAQYAALEAHLVELSAQNYEIPETVVFTDAGPFLPPVEVEAAPRLRAARSVRQAAAEDENGLILDKTAVPDGAGGYKIRLEAYTTGTVTTTTTTSPVDIVLVLDQSGSMAYDFNGNSTNTNTARRQYAMKQAVNNFISAVNAKYDGAHSDHRMAIVTFASSASTLQGWTNVDGSGKATLQSSINGLANPSGGTQTGAGMNQAAALMGSGYSYTGTNTTRQKVVIVFTDGVPTTEKDFSTTVANNAISAAKHLKDAGVTIYSVGIFNGANPYETYGASGFDTNSDGTEGSKWVKDTWGFFPGTDFPEADRPAGNRFLNYLSNNYGDAVNIGLERTTSGLGIFHYKITYTVTKNASQSSNRYYLTADSSASLNTIFQTISEQIGSANIDLGATTEIRDVVTPYFTMPENTSAISLYTADYDGTNFGEEEPAPDGVTAEIDGDTVTVTGFDFNANFVSDTPRGENETHGKKLVIEFTVTPREGFWGGDNVPTNGADSGVYTADGSEVERFDVHKVKVNVPLNVPDFTGNTVNVYYGGDVPADSTLYTPIERPTGEDDWKDDFVAIGAYTVDRTVSTTADGVYTVSVTATSGNQNQTKNANATVRVFLPQFAVNAQDVWADYGVAVPLARWGLIQEDGAPKVTVTWKREGVTEPVTMANAEPAISDYVFTFTASGTPDGTLSGGTYTTGTQDADFRVGLTSCQVGSTVYSVPADALTVVPAVSGEAHDFTVHINKFQMTVTKTATGADTYPQDFIFTVSDGTQRFQIVIHGAGSKTVVGLICGKTYTVTEEEGWSWRYRSGVTESVTCTPNSVSNTAPAEASLTAGTVTMPNTLDNDKWLSGEDMKANKFNKTRRRAVRKEG